MRAAVSWDARGVNEASEHASRVPMRALDADVVPVGLPDDRAFSIGAGDRDPLRAEGGERARVRVTEAVPDSRG
jgi:hypothetical protein